MLAVVLRGDDRPPGAGAHPLPGRQPRERRGSTATRGTTSERPAPRPTARSAASSRPTADGARRPRLLLGYRTVQQRHDARRRRRPRRRHRRAPPRRRPARRPRRRRSSSSRSTPSRACRSASTSSPPTTPRARSPSTISSPAAAARSTGSTGAGFEPLVAAQRRNLDRFWDRADVDVEDTVRHPVRMQQAVRWNLFQLAQATWRAEGTGIPAKGLTGDAYDGHYFWDTETYVLPFLAYTQPRIARNLLRFRHSMLPKARAAGRRARTCAGALFPWRTINGEEASAYYQAGHGPVPPQRRHRLRHPALRRRARRRRLPRRGRRRDPRRDGAHVGGPRLLRRRRVLPHPRRHRSRRVHDRRQRQRLHEPDGPAQPPLRRRGGAPARGRATRRLRGARAPSCALDPSELDAWDRAADAMYVPHDPARGHHPPGRHVPQPRALGPRAHAAGRSSRCCCTTTRSRSTATRCSSRPTW